MRLTLGAVGATRGPASLVFREAENLFPNPEAFNLWPNSANCVFSTDAVANPDGVMNAELITDNAIGSVGAVAVTSAALTLPTVSVAYRMSVYNKAGTVPWLRLSCTSLVGTTIDTYFNTATGAVGNTGASVTSSGVDAAIAGWRRFWIIFNVATDVSGTWGFSMCSGNGITTINRNGTQTMNLWLAQLARV